MENVPLSASRLALVVLVVGTASLGLAVWAWVFRRAMRGRPAVPWQRRRPVPWRGFHVIVIALLYLLTLFTLPSGVCRWLAEPAPPVAADGPREATPRTKTEASSPGQQPRETTKHSVGQLLSESHDVVGVLICILSAVVMAPLCEEFVFRLVLQGWLESREWRARRARRALRWRLPGLLPVVVVAVVFAGMHFRTAGEPEPADVLKYSLLGVSLANLLTVVLGAALLRLDAGATLVDLGVVRGKILSDFGLGCLAFPAIAVVIYPMQWAAEKILPAQIAPDPIGLVPLALMLGFLYLRTHRIAPSIAVHMALNATSLILLWLGAGDSL